MRIEKESDALNREYKRLSRMAERLTRKYKGDDAWTAIQPILQRQDQIIKELEECTGVQITLKTEKDILEENRRLQMEENKRYEKILTILDEAEEERRMKRENVRKQKLQERLQRGQVEGQTKLFDGFPSSDRTKK